MKYIAHYKSLKVKSRNRSKKKWILWGIGIIFVIVIVVFGVLLLKMEKPPVGKIEEARTILLNAQKNDAEIYSHRLYQEARNSYDSAMINWKRENEKLFFLRRYSRIKTMAQEAVEKGRKATLQAEKIKRDSKEEIKREIAALRQEMNEFEKLFLALPLPAKVKNQHAQGKLLLNEAEIAFEKGDYSAGRESCRKAADMIRTSYESGKELVEGYFENLPKWQKQLKEALERSRKEKEHLIVIEKIPPRCILYYKGEQKYVFPVEFGKNWMWNKRCEGDYATPEGEYKVVKKLAGSMTRYYKALLLNYPNADDRKNFAKLKREGVVSAKARPGSLIEIHGSGGRGGNWTNGCAALKDEDMSVLYRYANVGTPILIIGASER